jgi:endo-1,4-beta-xylanase
MTAISSKTILTTLAPAAIIAAVCSWAPSASAQSLVTNGTFDTEDYAPWWGHAATNEADPTMSAEQTLAVTDGQLCSTITAGGQNVWDVIIGLSELALLPNQYYHVKFTVSADANREVRFKTGLGDAPYTDYFLKTLTATPTPTVVEFTYLNLRDDPAAQIQFHIGGSPGTLCLDDIVLEPVDPPVVPPYVTPSLTGSPLKAHAALVKIGTAVDTPTFLSRPDHNAIVVGEFSMITPANSMKMNLIQPSQGVFDFTETDALYAFAQANGLEFHGHPLVWHTQVPAWLNDGTFDRDQMIAIMYAHIDALTQRYPELPYWDVVNEAIERSAEGVWGFRSTIWHDRIGPDFIDLAFQRARMNAPNAKLIYNDYNIEQKGNPKADYVFQLVSDMKARGVPIDQVGFQSHYYVNPDGDTSQGVPNIAAIRENMARYADIGVDVQITECDFRIGQPLTAEKQALQDKFYADLLQACIDAPNCSHFTVWGLSDLDSWVPSTFPGFDNAHIFDASLVAKSAYHAMTNVLAKYEFDGTPKGTPSGAGGSEGAGGSGVGGTGAEPGATAGTGAVSGGAPAQKSSGCAVAPGRTSEAPLWLAILGLLAAVARSSRRAKRPA